MTNKTILFQGDSITDCGRTRDDNDANIYLGSGYVSMCAARLLAEYPAADLKFYNRGISGNRVVDLYARWKIDALNIKPDVLSILIGVNDTWAEFGSKNGVEVERYGMFYDMLLEWTKKVLPNVKLVIIEPFVLETGVVTADWVSEITERKKIAKDLAEKYDAVYVEAQKLYDEAIKKASPSYWLGDGVHPTMPGHRILADAWLEKTKELFCSK